MEYETKIIPYKNFKLAAYIAGHENKDTLFLLNGGPGMACDYLRDPHLHLCKKGLKIVAYDQLGCGRSDRPTDPSLWTISRYAEEVEHVRKYLQIEEAHLLGQSWGSVLAIEYMVNYPGNFKTLILTDGVADIPFHIEEINRLREALGPETVNMMLRHEAQGTYEHPEYVAAITLLNFRHLCRLDVWPKSLMKCFKEWNMEIYHVMQGPNEFNFTGNLKTWSRLNEMRSISCPTLILCGTYDALTPRSSMLMKEAVPNSEIRVFKNSSHLPVFEEPEIYFSELENFLKKNQTCAAM